MNKNKVQFQKGLSLPEFLKDYGTEEQCFKALINLRWPEGFVCRKCQCKAYYRLKNRKFLFQCNACRSQTSITAGTIYHSTKLPLTKWFLATYLMTQSKSGISQLEFARQLGVSASTGRMVYHKLAQVMMERDSQKPLSENIEMDDAYWGGKKKGKRGRGSENKTPFVAAVEKNMIRSKNENLTKTYSTWTSMRQLCMNKNSPGHDFYARKGISICDDWMVFENFLKDMGEKPIGFKLNRKDKNKNFDKENCEWVPWSKKIKNEDNQKTISIDLNISELKHIRYYLYNIII